jgi:hypothetical protein
MVRFVERQRQTEVIVYHEGLPIVAARDSFIQGWRPCLTAMVELVRSQ